MAETNENLQPTGSTIPVRQDATETTETPSLTHVGPFELRREIGRGGMGTVYEAWCQSHQKLVAVKILGRHVSGSQQAIVRFKREAQAAARLQHDHITPIYTQGQDKDVYYYAMKLLSGPSLHELIRAQSLEKATGDVDDDPAETIALPRAVTSPANMSQSSDGTVDNPDNSSTATTVSLPRELLLPGHARYVAIAKHLASIAGALDYAHGQGIIHRDIKPHNLILGDDMQLHITDFGLARLAQEPGVTMTGEMLGSPLYMSPEQILQGPAQVDHRTDVYSLGVTMYEWLTLKPPYPGATRERVISQIVKADPKPPREHNPDIPAALETICLKAIEHDLTKRYESAGELRDDLLRFAAGKPIRARRAGLLSRSRKYIERHPVGALASAAALVAFSLIVALYTMRTEVRRTQARERAAQAQNDLALNLLTKMLPPEIGAPLSAVGAAMEGVSELVASAKGSTDPAATTVAPASLSTPTGVARRAAMDFYEDAVLPRNRLNQKDSPGIAKLFADAVRVRRSDIPTALTRADALLTIKQDHVPTLYLRTVLHIQTGHLSQAFMDLTRLAESSKGPPVHILKGIAQLLAGKPQESLTSFAQAENDPLVGVWCSALRGLALIQIGQAEAALLEADQALDQRPSLATALLAQSIAYGATGNAKAAIVDLTLLLDQEPKNAELLATRGQHYVATGEYAKAINDLERAIALGGPTPTLSFQLQLVKLTLMRQQNVAVSTPKTTDEQDPKAPNPESNETWNRRVKEWFSRTLWPLAPSSPSPAPSTHSPIGSSSLKLGRWLSD